ncbi:MAG: chemotaxis protein CheB [Steroidobacteraceae bacterium]
MTESDAAMSAGQPDPADVSAPVDFTDRAKLRFPVVGIGASAGGIQALSAFLRATTPDSGMAYVIVQHLSPDHESLMAEILGRHTTMRVLQIEDGMPVEPDHVYVIRPGHTVTLSDGALHLGEPVERPGYRRPVDDFFRSLAREQKEKAIIVVLSGMGTNGTAGAQAIKAVGGLCIAQDPEAAEFPGMPRSLIHAGYADQVLNAEDIPAVLLRFTQHPYLEPDPKGRARAQQELERHRQRLTDIINYVRERTGHNFAPYKVPTVLRRIQRRMGLFGAIELEDYQARLRKHPSEAAALANDLMINVTGFFRDPEAWEALRVAVVRPLVEQRAVDQPIRAWVTACASGEEAYSLAMLIAEEADRAGKQFDVKIFATDTADKSLALARAGVYPGGIEGDLTPERLDRFFDKDEHTCRIKKYLREQVVFAPQDMLRDPPFSRVDLVTCRNLLIYLEPDAQRRALGLMHFALRDGAHLLLGNAEALGEAGELFEVVSKRWRIYRRSGPAQQRFPPDLASLNVRASHTPPLRSAPVITIARPSIKTSVQAALLEKFGPPTAVVDANERIVYFHGDSGPYLMSPAGEFTQNLLEMVRSPLRPATRRALRKAIAEKQPVAIEQVLPGAVPQTIRITAEPLQPRGGPECFRVSFEPLVQQSAQSAAQTAHGPSAEIPVIRNLPYTEKDEVLEQEVYSLQRELQSSVEAFEATNEELKASNEEVTSVNEELQSTNEELETGKEELQSLNEELATVNNQLQRKVLELEGMTNDLHNLLSSTDIAVVFLDLQLRVKGFTPAINDLLELIATDIGRPLAHLAQKFTDEHVIDDAQRVIAKLVPLESEVRSHSGRWYLRRTLPYRTEDHRIAGVVITFIDISARKRAEQAIEAAQARLQAVIEQMPAAVLMAERPSGKLIFANRRASTLFGQSYPMPFIGSSWTAAHSAFRAFHASGRRYDAQEWPLARALARAESVLDEELDFVRPDGTRGFVSISAAPIYNASGEVVAAVSTIFDITERRRAAETLRDSEERFRLLVESAHDFAIFMLDTDGNVVSWNSGAELITGFSEGEIKGRSGALIFTPEDRASGMFEQELRNAAAVDRAPDERWHLRKDGTRFWASGMMNAARGADGTLRGFVKIMRDQTERRAMELRMHDALAAAEKLRVTAESANRAKDEFVSTVSHELRTPLNTIRLWSRMLASGRVKLQEGREGILMVERAAIAQQQLIDDLLDVSRMASGKLRLTLRDTQLSKAIDEAIESVRPVAQSRGVALECDLSPDVGIVRADPDRIQQVVWNLLTNAVKFTPSGGRVSVMLRRADESVEISVADTGIGIRPEFLPYIFERFRQADSSTTRQHGGLGLGLSIARQLVELHEGSIEAASDGEGHGSTFTVRLPNAKRLSALSPDESDDAEGGTHDMSGIDVLLVEDEPATRAATALLLRQHGANVREADSANAAREAIAIRRPQLLIADVGLPGEDGYMMLEELRRSEQQNLTPRIPAVAVTAFASSDDRKKAMASGFDEHLPKPLAPDRFVATVAKLLHRA